MLAALERLNALKIRLQVRDSFPSALKKYQGSKTVK